MNLTLMSGAGNRFAVLDGFAETLPADLPAIARDVCATVEPRVDGLLVVARPTQGGDCAMVLFNADGSRPETCGNGLRCVAKLVRDRGHVTDDQFTIESDAGPCPTSVERVDGRVVRARVHMGTPRVIARDVAIPLGGVIGSAGVGKSEGGGSELAGTNAVRGTLVDVGNPHCVLFVDDERVAPVTAQGPLIEKHALFPRGTNVEFLAVRGGRVFLRVWERGVGETQACGSGACAAAVAAVERGLARFPVRLELPGGTLEVDTDGRGGVFLTGPVEEHGTLTWDASAREKTRENQARAPR